MNLAVISYFVWLKVQDKEEVFMPDLLSLSVVLNCSKQSLRNPVFNALAVTALGNRSMRWYGIHSLFAVNMYNAKKHVHLSLLPVRTPAVQKEMKVAMEEWEVTAGVTFAGMYDLECLF